MYCSNRGQGPEERRGSRHCCPLDPSPGQQRRWSRLLLSSKECCALSTCVYLGTKRITLFLGELMVSGNILVVLRVFGDQRPLLQQVSVLGKALPISEIPHLRHQLMLRRAGKEVPDLGIDVVRQVCTVNCRGMVAAFLCMVGCFVLRSGVLLADPLPVQKRGKW